MVVAYDVITPEMWSRNRKEPKRLAGAGVVIKSDSWSGTRVPKFNFFYTKKRTFNEQNPSLQS
jgi:hypothetical protein